MRSQDQGQILPFYRLRYVLPGIFDTLSKLATYFLFSYFILIFFNLNFPFLRL